VALSTLRFHVVDEYGRVEPSGAISRVTTSELTPFGGSGRVGFSFRVSLQARRFGFDFDGRQYAIVITADDVAGNAGLSSARVVVPHDLGRHDGSHGTGHPGMSAGAGVTSHLHRFHGHYGKVGKSGAKEGHRAAGSSNSARGTVVGVPTLPGDNQGNSNGHEKGNGRGQGNSGGRGSGNGKGKGKGTD
jgi:hypothetical protein